MSIIFKDLQEPGNPLNGTQIDSAQEFRGILRRLAKRTPFLFELRSDKGYRLTIGYAGQEGCAQYSASDGSPPYLMATSSQSLGEPDFVQFLAGDTPTPIPGRFCLPINVIEHVAKDFIEGAKRSEAVGWEEI